MRLLHFDDTGRLIQIDFSGKSIPPYAVLSHRWGPDEVSFEDLILNSYKGRDGFRKIEFCARQAAQDQLHYFWVDTCCIDKWNRRELSHAINSMFHWYRDATRCYVYLPSISVSCSSDICRQNTWDASLRRDEWFQRGWTLQELIAPKFVEFFSLEGYRLGDKRSLEQLIHEITRVPVEALRGCPLQDFSKRDRINWAEFRKTTEPEDSAYCLLGILNVFMLTSYGEGKEKALSRLYDELETESISAYTIPFSRNPQFVGRESQLALLESKLFRDNEKTTRVAIQGSGGTGKSQLALELAYRTKEEYKSCSIFWIDASEPDAFYQAYSNIAQKLDIHRGSDEQVDVRQLVKLELSRKNTRQWLLIIDNADDLNLGSAQSLVDYFPQSNMGSIILTSTSSDAAKAMAGENVVQLLEMTLHSARTMLENQLTSSNLIRQEKEVQLLLEQLSCLPLSIVQAAAYINNTENITLEAYRLRVITEKMDWFRASGPSCEKRLSDSDAGSPATATALISLHQIRHNHSSAAHCLFLAACVSPKDIPLDLIGAISSRAKENAVRVLDAYALATRRPAESSFDIHRLLHLAIQGWLRKQSSLQGWAERAIAILLEIFPANPDQDMWSRSKWRRLLPHAMYALSTAQESEAWVRLSRRCTAALMDDGRWKEAEGLQVQIIEATKRVLGLEHEQTLAVMSDLALIYRRQKRLKEAEVLGLDLIVTYKRLSGAEDSKLLECMGNLGSTYHDQGRWKEAEELQVQATELAKRVLGLEHADTAASMNNLANTYVIQGRHREAEELQVQVVEIHKRVRGAEHPKTTSAMNNLALMLMGRGQWREAEELQVQVVETKKRVLGAEHPDTLEVLRNLILIYEHQGRWNEVEELLWEHRRFTVGEQVESEGPWREAEELQWENV